MELGSVLCTIELNKDTIYSTALKAMVTVSVTLAFARVTGHL